MGISEEDRKIQDSLQDNDLVEVVQVDSFVGDDSSIEQEDLPDTTDNLILPRKKEKYPILIEEGLDSRIKNFSKIDRKRLNKAISDLSSGYWELGIRVKKLKGHKETVFEARLDRSKRILFQFRSVPLEGQRKRVATILLMDIVRHKKVNSASSKQTIERLNLQKYNTYLTDKSIVEIEIKSLDEIPYKYYPILDEIFNQENELQPIESYDETGLPNGIKFYRFDKKIREIWVKDNFLQKTLALSQNQQIIVYKDPPVFINGGAGTGKTTVLAHIYKENWENKKRQTIYVTLTPQLRDFIREILNEMFEEGPLRTETQKRVITFNQLCKLILRNDSEKFDEDDEVTLDNFIKWIGMRQSIKRDFDTLKLWQEYFGVIKGQCSDPELGIISKKEYLKKPRGVSLFNEEKRERIYELLSEYYKEQKFKNKWDTLDLAQTTYDKLLNLDEKEVDNLKIEAIVCDEIQDLVMIQYRVLNIILSSKMTIPNLYFGGDTQQTINSSNFRWDDLRSFIYQEYKDFEIKVPKLIYMTRNFRSTSVIVQTANKFLEFKKTLGLAKAEDKLQEGIEKFDQHYYPVLLIKGSLEDFMTHKEELVENTGRLIISYNEHRHSQYKQFFAEGYIMKVMEVKGLEFISTLLYNVVTDTELEWRNILNKDLREKYIKEHELDVTYSLSRIYVALTRARRSIFIFEEDPYAVQFWRGLMSDGFKEIEFSEMLKLWKVKISKDEALREAEYFYRERRFRIAADFYKNVGAHLLAEKALAMDYMQNKKYKKALKIFLDQSEDKLAAECYEKLEVFQEAQKHYKIAGETKHKVRCQALYEVSLGNLEKGARLFEKNQQYSKAAQLFEELGNKRESYRLKALNYEFYKEFNLAAKEWNKYGDKNEEYRCLTRYHVEREEFDQAAKIAENKENWNDAIEFWKKHGDNKNTSRAQAYQLWKESQYSDAENLLRKYDLWDDRLKLWKKDRIKTAEIYKERGKKEKRDRDLIRAIDLYFEQNNIEQVEEIIEFIIDNQTKIPVLERLGKLFEAAELAEENRLYNKAGSLWIQLQEFERAINNFELAKSWNELGEVLELVGRNEEAIPYFERTENWLKVAENQAVIGKHAESALTFEENDFIKEAIIQYKLALNFEKVIELSRLINDYTTVIEYAKEIDDNKTLEEIYNKQGMHKELADLYVQLKKYERATKYYEIALDSIKYDPKVRDEIINQLIMVYGSKLKNYKSAADLAFKIKLYDEAIKYYKKLEDWESVAKSFKFKKNLRKAAEYYEKAENFLDAGYNYERSGKFEKALEMFKLAENYERVVRLAEKRNWNEEAAIAYEKLEEFEKAAKNWKLAGNNLKSDVNYIKANRLDIVITSRINDQKYEESCIFAELAGNQNEIVLRSLLKLEDNFRLGEYYENLALTVDEEKHNISNSESMKNDKEQSSESLFKIASEYFQKSYSELMNNENEKNTEIRKTQILSCVYHLLFCVHRSSEEKKYEYLKLLPTTFLDQFPGSFLNIYFLLLSESKDEKEKAAMNLVIYNFSILDLASLNREDFNILTKIMTEMKREDELLQEFERRGIDERLINYWEKKTHSEKSKFIDLVKASAFFRRGKHTKELIFALERILEITEKKSRAKYKDYYELISLYREIGDKEKEAETEERFTKLKSKRKHRKSGKRKSKKY